MSQSLEKTVLESLEKEEPNILKAACLMAGILGLQQAERGLIKALGHKAWQIQAEAAKALGLLRAKGARPFLRRILKATDADLRQKVLAAAAGQLKDEAQETNPELFRQAAIALNRIDPATAEQALSAALSTDNPQLITAALAGLANLRSEGANEKVMELLESDQPAMRSLAAAAAGKLLLREATPGLARLLQDDEAPVRKEAVIALNHIKDARAIGPLTSLLEDSSADVRRVVAIALGNTKSKSPEMVEALVAGLNDHDAQVRQACLSALANLKADTALEKAAALLADSNEQVAKQAAITVSNLALAREKPDYQL